jgi:hypothetical protein
MPIRFAMSHNPKLDENNEFSGKNTHKAIVRLQVDDELLANDQMHDERKLTQKFC